MIQSLAGRQNAVIATHVEGFMAKQNVDAIRVGDVDGRSPATAGTAAGPGNVRPLMVVARLGRSAIVARLLAAEAAVDAVEIVPTPRCSRAASAMPMRSLRYPGLVDEVAS